MNLTLGPTHDGQRFRSNNRLALAVVFIGVLLLGTRLGLVQVVRGERYQKYAAIERVAKVRAQAPRGLVKGVDGEVLARNIESHSLEIMTNRVKPERIPAIALKLRELLDVTDAEYDQLLADLNKPVDPRKRRPLVVRKDLVSTHCPYDSSPLKLVAEVTYGFCSLCGRTYEPLPDKHTCPFDQRRLVQVGAGEGKGGGWHCPSCDRDFLQGNACPFDQHLIRHGQHNLQCPLCQRTFNDEVAVLRAHLHQLPEARVQADIQREYPFRYLASHVLGYMGYVDQRDMEPVVWLGPPRFAPTDRVGRSGVEKRFDTILRGVDGEQILVKRAGTEEQAKDLEELTSSMEPRPVLPGQSVRLTLDLELQRAAKVAMKDVYAGAVVVLDVHTGAVLAMYSKPSFDPNTMSGKRTPQTQGASDVAAYAPLLNRAVHAFPPASTFKVVAAVAGLELGIIRPNSTWRCPGYYDFGGRRFHCHLKRGHGEVNVQQALRSSCDVFFYHLGEQLGLDRMEEYARKLGFGEATGIEIQEATGRVPSMEWYKQHVKGGYYPGYALSTAVGQKDVTATPLQLARVYAALATGHLADAGLVAGLETQDGKVLPRPRGPGRDLEFKRSTLQLVRAALRSVVNEEGGTAYSAQPLHTTMAGKTGTAQAPQRPRKEVLELLHGDTAAINRLASWLQNDHAWFVGYAPADAPEIAVAVFVEHGGSGGHNAAPVGKAVVESWFARHGPKVQPVETLPVAPRKARVDKKDSGDEDPAAEVPVHDPEASPSVPDDGDDPLPGVTAPVPPPVDKPSDHQGSGDKAGKAGDEGDSP